jgi:diguanylate cyclase (GGDEF)-like protein
VSAGYGRTIASRLYLVGALALAAVLVLAGVSIFFAANTWRTADSLYRSGLVTAVEAGRIELYLERHRRLIEAAPLEFDRIELTRRRDEADEVARSVDELIVRSGTDYTGEVAAALPGLWRMGAEVLRLADNFAQAAALDVLKFYLVEAARLQARVRVYRVDRVSGANREALALANDARALVDWVTVLSVIAALLIGPLAFYLLRGMVLRLEQITVAMRQLAHSDMDVVIEVDGRTDEIGEMAEALSVFRTNGVQLLEHKARLEKLNEWLDIAFNNMERGLCMFDSDRKLIVCNSVYQNLYSLTDDLVRPGTPLQDILENRSISIESIEWKGRRTNKDAVDLITEFAVGQANGSMRVHLLDGRTIDVMTKRLPDGGWVAVHEDVTERFEAAEKISRLARQDTLTELANRHHFLECLEAATGGLDYGQNFALHVIDLDRFKEVNDSFGHPVGDALLIAVGRRLRALTRSGDVVARFGGDEFAIIQDRVTCKADAEALGNRIAAELGEPFDLAGHNLRIGGTIGVALAPEHGCVADELMKNADLALYQAKGEERGTVQVFDPEMQGRLREGRALEAELALATQRGEMMLFYQPIISLSSDRVAGCEALIRWRHPSRGMVSPAEFIPLAESNGFIQEIGAWALREACRTAALWPDDLKVAVNLSIAQFSGPDLAEIAADALAESGLAPERLELEVTETLLLGDDPATLEILHRLRDLGIAIALDDFGTGYSSLSHLRSFPFDKIKIDQSFVRDLPQRRNCEAIVGAVARLASSLDMTTVAEGVETADHLEKVRAAGCDFVQGYLFARPVPEDKILEVIDEVHRRLESVIAA